jgi:selenocysteine-specific elongation factor
VVTGTLSDGSLSLGNAIEIVPSHQRGRIRNLETHKRRIEKALPGTRVAVNLSGVAYDSIKRGDVLALPGWLEATRSMDINLRIIPRSNYSLKHNASISFHTGSSQSLGKIRLLNHNEIDSSERAWGQVRLQKPIVAVKGDPFLIRSSSSTIGGGTIIDPKAKKRRRFEDNLDRQFLNLTSSSIGDVITSILEEHRYLKLNDLAHKANVSTEEAKDKIKTLSENNSVITIDANPIHSESILLSSKNWNEIQNMSHMLLDKFHNQHPLRKGLPKEDLRRDLKLPAQIFSKVLARLDKENTLDQEGPLAHLPTYKPQLSQEEMVQVNKYLKLLKESPYSVTVTKECDPDLLNYMINRGDIIRISADLVLSIQTYNDILKKVSKFIRQHDKIKVSEARDMLGTSRKFALPIMEYLDQMHVTRRIGDERVLE